MAMTTITGQQMKRFHELLKDERMRMNGGKGVKPRDLAEKFKVPVSVYEQWENGEGELPRASVISRVFTNPRLVLALREEVERRSATPRTRLGAVGAAVFDKVAAQLANAPPPPPLPASPTTITLPAETAPPSPPPPAPAITFGASLREERTKAKLEREELAQLIGDEGVSASTISKWELNERTPIFDHFLILLRLFPVLVDAPKPVGLVRNMVKPGRRPGAIDPPTITTKLGAIRSLYSTSTGFEPVFSIGFDKETNEWRVDVDAKTGDAWDTMTAKSFDASAATIDEAVEKILLVVRDLVSERARWIREELAKQKALQDELLVLESMGAKP